jgi:hypothetical protein
VTSQATLQVVRGSRVVATLVSASEPAGTPVTASWGGPAPDGRYALRLTVGTVVRSLPLVVDTRKPVLRVVSWTHLRFRVSKPATLTLAGGGRRWTKSAVSAGIVAFSLRSPPRAYTVVARDAAGNASLTLRRR